MKSILENIKVLELSNVLAGPSVGMFFAELGAEVVKVENKMTGGDLTRQWKLPFENEHNPASFYYYSANWNKEVVFLNLLDSSDREELEKFLAVADILLINFKKGDAQRFDLETSVLHKRYPSLIIGEITGFDDDRVAYDAVLQAETGFMSLNGEEGGLPLKMPVALIDVLTAHQLKEGILLALLQRNITGKGAFVTASLYRTGVSSLVNQASTFLNTGIVPSKMGSLHPTIAPYGEVFKCEDNEYILLAIGTDAQFSKFCKVMGLIYLVEDDRFATNQERVRNRMNLNKILSECIVNWSSDGLIHALNLEKVPAAVVHSIDQVFENKTAQSMVLTQQEPDGVISKRVSTIAFDIAFL